MSITITKDTNLIQNDGWDFPIEELDYLLDEHDNETFTLKDNRLYEAKPNPSERKTIIIHDTDDRAGYILAVISIQTTLDAETIQQIFDNAKNIARKETGGEWQTQDVIDRLPKEWNAQPVNDAEVWI